MTEGDPAQARSPWLSVWLRPRLTIERVLARYSTPRILLLAGLNAIFAIAAAMAERQLTAELLDWRVLAGLALGGGALGIAFLYLGALFFKWSGRLFRGRASAAELRAVLAWGRAPNVMGLAVAFAGLIGLTLAGMRPGPQAIEVALQAVTGVLGIWSLVALLLMLSRVQKFGFWRTIVSYALVYTLLLLPLLLRTFAFEPFNAPSGSMAPTILVGDYFFVSKYRYGYSRYSLPFSQPPFASRVMASAPERGDVVVYRHPQHTSDDYVKRVVGLPGDRIQLIDGVLHINGQPVAREPLGDFLDIDSMRRVKRWRETLPSGVSYEVLDAGDSFGDNTGLYTVPAGRYFVIGDNRNNSVDSRLPEAQGGGFVPFENLIGRAEIIFFSSNSQARRDQPSTRFERIGLAVR